MVASALKQLLNTQKTQKRVSVDKQRAQKYYRFLRGRQIAYMIYEHFRATGACEAVQGLSDLFNIRLHEDDVQDFNVRCDQALLSGSDMPSDVILEGVCKSKIRRLCSASDHLSFVRSRNRSKPCANKLFTLEDICETSY